MLAGVQVQVQVLLQVQGEVHQLVQRPDDPLMYPRLGQYWHALACAGGEEIEYVFGGFE